ncbi:unnamed protein product [Orchesella dallaii]|uniref:tRNA-t(6)A37 methylthiotransferase n=1 Tax=Orchesella dallaii TaxID=48710 RepID=A0ABP1PNV9_9HEXA
MLFKGWRYDDAQVVVLNSCTVKGPSEQHFKNEIDRALKGKKHVVLAGCVVQSDRSYRSVASVIGVQQIDKIVEVVEETIKGHKVSFMSAKRHGKRSPGAELALPKIRKNELIEIVPISTGCLNNCTYCKTKHARGQLASYSIDSIVSRIRNVCEYDKVVEIWLTSEDLGAWGIDLGHTIPELLNSIVNVLPKKCMLRLGMSNPPYMLDHLDEISRILSHPNVYEFLHIPVQSGSDSVLLEMKREYSISDFQKICDFMLARHPNITIATDIICGYPTETDEDFKLTYELVNKYKFPVLFINQFYPRPGTVAAKLKRIPTHIVKARTRQLNELFLSYTNIHKSVLGTTQTVLVTDIAHDKVKFLAHNKFYQQVLIDPGQPNIMGQWVNVKIVSFGKFSMVAQIVYSSTFSQILFTIIIFTCYILFYLK